MHSGSVAQSISEYGLSRCYRCGACSAACPMRNLYPGFPFKDGPRSVIAKLLLLKTRRPPVRLAELLEYDGLWMCLTCEACLNICPQGVKFRDFVGHVRDEALENGLTGHFAKCSCCGRSYLPKAVVEALGRFLPEEESRELLRTCPRCRRRAYGRRLRHPGPVQAGRRQATCSS